MGDLATILAGVNDGGNNFSCLKLAYTDYSIEYMYLMYADHVIATTLEAAKPMTPRGW